MRMGRVVMATLALLRRGCPRGIELVISSKIEQGTKWIGKSGWLWVNRGKIKASNPQWVKADPP